MRRIARRFDGHIAAVNVSRQNATCNNGVQRMIDMRRKFGKYGHRYTLKLTDDSPSAGATKAKAALADDNPTCSSENHIDKAIRRTQHQSVPDNAVIDIEIATSYLEFPATDTILLKHLHLSFERLVEMSDAPPVVGKFYHITNRQVANAPQ